MKDCAWNVAAEDRLCEYCSYDWGCAKRSCHHVLPMKRDYIEEMSAIMGYDVSRPGRLREKVMCRYMVALQMTDDGFKSTEVGNTVGLARCTISYGVHSMRHILANPQYYPVEAEIWKKYQKSINLKKHELKRQNSVMVAAAR